MQQQYLDQQPPACAVAGVLACQRPERVVRRSEGAGGPGLRECGGAGQRAGLARQDLEVVVQQQHGAALANRPGVPGDLDAAVEDHHLRRPERHPDPPADQPDGHRVLALPNRDAGVSVDPRRQGQTRVEAVGGQRSQQRPLKLEVGTDRAGAVLDPPGEVGLVSPLEPGIELAQGRDVGLRDEVVAPEPADLALHSALLMRSLNAGHAVEGVEPGVRAKQRPPVGLGAGAPEQHPGHGAPQVVVADVHRRDPEDPERLQVSLDERLLSLGGVDAVDRGAAEAQAEGEHEAAGLLTRQGQPDVAEVDLGLLARRVGLRDERLLDRPADLGLDLRPSAGHVVTHAGVRHVHDGVLVDQAGEDPPGGVLLLAVRGQVLPQHHVDQWLNRVQLRRREHPWLPLRRRRGRQRLPHGAAVHRMPLRQRPDRQLFQAGVAADCLEQLHPAHRPPPPPRGCRV